METLKMNGQDVTAVIQGATSTQIGILIFLGILAAIGVYWMIEKVVKLHTGNLPDDLNKINESINQINLSITEIRAKLWSKDDVREIVKSELTEHVNHYHNNQK